MIRTLGLAIGFFLLSWGVFLFCVEDVVLRYQPNWLHETGMFSQFIHQENNQIHLIIDQWIAILVGTVGCTILVLCMGRRRAPQEEKCREDA